MFDIGFSELMLIGVVALIVLGPERLPKVARSAGQWIGRAQRYVNDIKADIAREADLADLKSLREQVETAGRDVENTIRNESNNLSTELDQAARPNDVTAVSPEAIVRDSPPPDAAVSISDSADQQQQQRIEAEILFNDIAKLEERLLRLRHEAETLRSQQSTA